MSLAEFQFGPEAIEYIRGRLALGNTLSKLAQALQLSEGTIRAYLPSTVSSEQAKLTLEHGCAEIDQGTRESREVVQRFVADYLANSDGSYAVFEEVLARSSDPCIAQSEGEQAADGDAVLGVEGDGGAQEGDGGLGLLVGQHAGEGEAGVIVDGDVQSLPAGELRAAAPPPVAPNGDLLIAGHALDVEMEQIAGSGMLVAYDGRSGMQMTPAVQLSALQDAADGGGAEMGGLRDVTGGAQLATQADDLSDQLRRSSAGAMEGTRGTIPQAGQPQAAIAVGPLSGGLSAIIILLAKVSRLRKVSRAFW